MSVLIQSMWVPAALSALYTNNQATTQIIDHCDVRNNDTGLQTATIYLVGKGTTPDASMIRLTTSVSPGQNDHCDSIVGTNLDPGDSIWGLASAAVTLSIRVNGRTT